MYENCERSDFSVNLTNGQAGKEAACHFIHPKMGLGDAWKR